MNVSQLKRELLGAMARAHLKFPRSNERGSIEAPLLGVEEGVVNLFPRSNERGSIEAVSS